MAIYDVVKRAKDGAVVGVGTLRTRWGKPVELVLRVPTSGTFELARQEDVTEEVTVPGGRPRSAE